MSSFASPFSQLNSRLPRLLGGVAALLPTIEACNVGSVLPASPADAEASCAGAAAAAAAAGATAPVAGMSDPRPILACNAVSCLAAAMDLAACSAANACCSGRLVPLAPLGLSGAWETPSGGKGAPVAHCVATDSGELCGGSGASANAAGLCTDCDTIADTDGAEQDNCAAVASSMGLRRRGLL